MTGPSDTHRGAHRPDALAVFRTPGEMRAWTRQRRKDGITVGFVPTMGALHDGHIALVREAHRLCDAVVVSIFVNPTQFNVAADFEKYPRTVESDLALAAGAGVDAVYLPDVEVMYPDGHDTKVHVERTAAPLEGAGRPGHFDGVATVVTKLFNAVEPDVAVFGRKDYQQLAVVTRMVTDLDMATRIVGLDTVREPDGLAMSSRNARLTPSQRADAPAVHRALVSLVDSVRNGQTSCEVLKQRFTATLAGVADCRVEYVSVADAVTLEEQETVGGPVVASCAVWFGDVRLIDNLVID